MTNENYNVDYFIGKFSALSDDKWCSRTLQDDYQRSCALGHCGLAGECQDFDANFNLNNEATSLVKLFKQLRLTRTDNMMFGISANPHYSYHVVYINDGETQEYQQETPKQRILAALYDIKKMQEPQPTYPDLTKSLAILPIEEVSDKINNERLVIQ